MRPNIRANAMIRLHISRTMPVFAMVVVLGCMRIDKSRQGTTIHRLDLLGDAVKAVVAQPGGQVPLRTIADVLVATKGYRELSEAYLGEDGWNRRFSVSDSMVTDELRVICVHSLGANVSDPEDDLLMCVLVGSGGTVDLVGPKKER